MTPPDEPSRDEWLTAPPRSADAERNWTTVPAGPDSNPNTPSTVYPSDEERRATAPIRLEAQGYEVLGELGRGGMGVVYRARHLATGDVVALKTLQRLTPSALYRFKQEFRVVAGLAHPNLITLRELVSDGATWFFTMELLDGVDLRTHVQGGPRTASRAADGGVAPLSAEALTRLPAALGQLAEGVAALHNAGVLHRDVKPSNVLVTPAGRVVLLDFGLAGERTPHGVYHTSPGQVCGTVAYMAPEQAAGEALYPAADW